MFTQRADVVCRKFIALVDITADFADKTFLSFGFRFWFYVVLVVGVSHGILIAHDTGLCDAADEHSVSAEIHIVFYLQGHESIDIFVQEYQAVVGVVYFLSGKFIGASAGLKAKLFKNRERSICGQAVYVHDTGLLDHVVRVVCLVDVDSHAIWVVGKLCNGIDDQTVVLFAIVGGYHIEAVTDAEQSSHIILVGKIIAFCNVFLAELISHSFHLPAVFFVYCRHDLNCGIQPADLFAFGKHFFHNLRCQRCPGSVFNQSYRAVLEVVLCQSGNKVVHKRIDACIICGGCENQLGVTESIAQCLGHIVSCKIIDNNVWTSFAAEFIGQLLNGHFCMTVYRCVGDDNSVILRCVGRPGIIEANIMSKIFSKNRSVERADGLDIQSCGCFQKVLHLHTIFSNDADIVSSCLIVPWFLCIQGTEFSEAVCGKKNLFCAVISDHNLRPVNHRCKYESKDVFSKCQGVTVGYNMFLSFQIHSTEEILHHGKGLCVGNNSCIRVCFHEILNICCMVRLHMLDYKIIRFRTIQNLCNFSQPLFCEAGIYSVHNCDLLIFDHIGVVGHSVWHYILSLKQVYLMIVYSYIINIISDFHCIEFLLGLLYFIFPIFLKILSYYSHLLYHCSY